MEWKFKKYVKDYNYDDSDFWYDLTDGGYLNIEEYLDDPDQIEELNKAIELVKSFELAMIDISE